VSGKTGDQGVELTLGEAVEEEVCGDEVGVCRGGVFEGAVVVGAKPSGGAACAKEAQHGGAGIYGVCLDFPIRREKTGEEATIAVTEDQGMFAIEQKRNEVGATALQYGTEGEVLEPAVGPGDWVEVGIRVGSRCQVIAQRGMKKSNGVRSARSAAALRVVVPKFWR
jgi:hypothetical protein